jgi:2-iminobutanoate/2-iminopropanoate deaminase
MAFAQTKQIIAPPGSQIAGIPFSPGVKTGDIFYVAGTMGTDAAGKVISGGIEAQTTQTLRNIGAILKAGGMDYKDVVAVNVYLADSRDFNAMNTAYREFFPSNPPVRATVETDLMLRDGLIEISAVAVRPEIPRQYINPAGWPSNPLPYSRAIKAGDYFFMSGLVSQNPQTGQPVAGDATTQTKQILDNARVLVEAAGFQMSDITTSRVWLTDARDFQQMNGVYRTYFGAIPPTRATVRSRLTSPVYKVEIMLSGVKGERQRLGTTGQTPLSQAIKVGNKLYVSGITTGTPRGDIKAQATSIMTTIQNLLTAGGMTFDDVVDAQVWITDPRNFAQMNEVYVQYIKGNLPTRATVGTQLMSADGLVEIAVTAMKN